MTQIRKFLIVSILSILATTLAGSQEIAIQADLPVVEATATEVDFVKSLVGTGRILFAPKTFGEYWPDYGYSWGSVRHGAGCNVLNERQRLSEIGDVSIVAPKPGLAVVTAQTSDDVPVRYVGFEITNKILSDIRSDVPDESDLTLQQLCEWFRDDEATTQLESYFDRVSALWSANGTWTTATFDPGKQYQLISKGQIIDSNEAPQYGATTWKVSEDKMLSWQVPQSPAIGFFDPDEDLAGIAADDLHTPRQHAGSTVWKYTSVTGGPTYYLKPEYGNISTTQFTTEIAAGGTIESPSFPSSERGAMFSLWSDVKAQPAVAQDVREWLLVTEHTLPNPELTAGIRVQPTRNIVQDW